MLMGWLLRPKKKSSGKELTPMKKVPKCVGTIGKSIRLEPWEGELAWGRLVGNLVIVRGAETPFPRQVWQKMTQQWDTTVANDEKPTEKARAIRARQRAIGRELRRMYDDVAQEAVPDEFMELLRQIDENDGKKVS
jgi:Anti-sigma factor NepR